MSSSSEPSPFDDGFPHEGRASDGCSRDGNFGDGYFSDDFSADRYACERRASADLEILMSDPSLAVLARNGWLLDDLPTSSVTWAFAAALATTLLAFGTIGAAMLVVVTLFPILLATAAAVVRDVAAERVTLRATRAGLLVWLMVSAIFL